MSISKQQTGPTGPFDDCESMVRSRLRCCVDSLLYRRYGPVEIHQRRRVDGESGPAFDADCVHPFGCSETGGLFVMGHRCRNVPFYRCDEACIHVVLGQTDLVADLVRQATGTLQIVPCLGKVPAERGCGQRQAVESSHLRRGSVGLLRVVDQPLVGSRRMGQVRHQRMSEAQPAMCADYQFGVRVRWDVLNGRGEKADGV